MARHSSIDDLWVTIDGRAYDLTRWVHSHPGGQLPLLSLAGRDASDAFEAFHGPPVRAMLAPFCVGGVRDSDGDNSPDPMLADFRQLRARLRARGLFKPTPLFYAARAATCAAIFAAVVATLRLAPTPFLRLLAAPLLGIFWQQVAFAGHDAGHNAVSGRRLPDSLLGVVLGNALTGVGIGWWKARTTQHNSPAPTQHTTHHNNGHNTAQHPQATHNVHHCVVNSVDHDPDIQHMPFLAISPEFVKGDGVFSRYHMARVLSLFDRVRPGPVRPTNSSLLRVSAWWLSGPLPPGPTQDRLVPTPFARLMVSLQPLLFFPLLLVARYGLVLQGVKTVGWEWGKRHTGFGSPRGAVNWTRFAEAGGFGVYFGYVGWLLSLVPTWTERVAFVVLSHAAFSILHLQARGHSTFEQNPIRTPLFELQLNARSNKRSQINLSHWSKPTYLGRPGGNWVETQLAGTLDWSCPGWLDWFHGGLQFQIEHHLFPRMPRANLRKARSPLTLPRPARPPRRLARVGACFGCVDADVAACPGGVSAGVRGGPRTVRAPRARISSGRLPRSHPGNPGAQPLEFRGILVPPWAVRGAGRGSATERAFCRISRVCLAAGRGRCG